MEKNRIQKTSKIQKLLKENPQILVSLKKKYKFDYWALNTVGHSFIYFLDLNGIKFEMIYPSRTYDLDGVDRKRIIQVNCKKTFADGSTKIPLAIFETVEIRDSIYKFLQQYLIGSWPYSYLPIPIQNEVKKEFERQEKIDNSLNI